MAPNHISLNQLIYRYPPREEPAQKEVLLYYVISSKNIRRHPNSVPRCLDPDLLWNLLFLNYKVQHAKNKFENRFSIPL